VGHCSSHLRPLESGIDPGPAWGNGCFDIDFTQRGEPEYKCADSALQTSPTPLWFLHGRLAQIPWSHPGSTQPLGSSASPPDSDCLCSICSWPKLNAALLHQLLPRGQAQVGSQRLPTRRAGGLRRKRRSARATALQTPPNRRRACTKLGGNMTTGFAIWRRAVGITQECAADRLGVHVRTVRKFERGEKRPSYRVELLMSLAARGVDLEVEPWSDCPHDAAKMAAELLGVPPDRPLGQRPEVPRAKGPGVEGPRPNGPPAVVAAPRSRWFRRLFGRAARSRQSENSAEGVGA
jgi:DNA-binding transcriptional regulator YiaG